MTDLVVLLPNQKRVSRDQLKGILDANDATVASFMVPRIDDAHLLSKEQFLNFSVHHGVDMREFKEKLTLKDIIVYKLHASLEEEHGSSCLLFIWNCERSTLDIDAVRVPHEGWTDPRNNPKGKNPGNIWHFAGILDGMKADVHDISTNGPTLVDNSIEIDVIDRLVKCHTIEGDTVHFLCQDGDIGLLERKCNMLGRIINQLDGQPRQFTERSCMLSKEQGMVLDGKNTQVSIKPGSCQEISLYHIMDARIGLASISLPPIHDVVTSPPYNIGYDPFNVPKPDPSTGELVDPGRKGYLDEMPEGRYKAMLQEVFYLLDARMSTRSADVFINMKNKYQGGKCIPPFWLVSLVPKHWSFTDLLVWRYDISYDPARNKYKPYYEWILRFSKGIPEFRDGHVHLKDFYLPILKGNSKERRALKHPAIFPKQLVKRCLVESRHDGLILDPFLGSGSTIAAAIEIGRPATGFEKNVEYQADIELRISRARKNFHDNC